LKRQIGIALSLCLMLAGLAAPVQAQDSVFGPDDADEVYYWVSQNSTLPLFQQYDYVGMEKIANELGVQVRVAGPTTIDLPSLIAAIDQVCAQNPAGVSVVGWDPSLTEPVNRCIEMGVPTVVDDGDLPGSKRLAFIGSDWTSIGEAQAQAMMDALPDGGKLATLSIINAAIMRDAVQGFRNYIEANGEGKYEIVADEDDQGSSAVAAQLTAALLAAHPDLAGVAGFDSESGAGITVGLQEAGKQPGEVVVTAMEQSPDFFKRIDEGWVEAIIVQNRELFIYYAIKMLHDFNHNGLRTVGLSGWDGVPIPPVVDTGVLVVDADNVGKVIETFE
jgi:ribose transport system substrate-binding protein